MSEFSKRLAKARNGEAILFCGAGFSADCLNFSEDIEVGTGAQLLFLLNDKLREAGQTSGYKDIKNASGAFMKHFGEHGLLNLLQDRYAIKNVTADMVEILKFPWSRVYTTNYDDAIERACVGALKQANPLNNLDKPVPISKTMDIVHLHGFIKAWDIHNFTRSCVLDAMSYLRLEGVATWLHTFREDLEKAQIVAFVGFNAADFHINEAIYDISGLREKIFFINRPAAEPDPDVAATQRQFGTPLFIGRDGLSQQIASELAKQVPEEPARSSFRKFEAPSPAVAVPGVAEIENLLMFGRVERSQLARDIARGRSDYHVIREVDLPAGSKITLMVGEICDGKSLIVEQLSLRLSRTRPVFLVNKIYDDILDEFSKLSSYYENAVFIIENCFDIREDRLLAMARQCSAAGSSLLLTSRNIVADTEGARVAKLAELESFEKIAVQTLSDGEVGALILLVNQIAGWTGSGVTTDAEKRRFIAQKCQGRLPTFLLSLLKSDYVRDKYREEYNKAEDFSESERAAIIASLYISHIGHPAPVEFLSNALSFDVGGAIDKLAAREDPFRIVHRDGRFIGTVPAIGAANILEYIIGDADIVDVVVEILEYLASIGSRSDFEGHIYTQMMRYSILRKVVKSDSAVERFFDNISKNPYYQSRVLFWLQWHMAMSDMKKFTPAERYLERGYEEAEKFEKGSGRRYNRKQLDDRKAKFLMRRAEFVPCDNGKLFSDFNEAADLISKLFQEVDMTHHPYESLRDFSRVFMKLRGELNPYQRGQIKARIERLLKQADTVLPRVQRGFQHSRALNSLDLVRAEAEQ